MNFNIRWFRVYINWWNKESVLQPMRARVAAVTPGRQYSTVQRSAAHSTV